MSRERTIAELLAAPKTVARVRRGFGTDPEHARIDIDLDCPDAPGKLVVFVRVLRALAENFSIGLRLDQPGQAPSILLRVNGDHGRHRNPDGGWLEDAPHVHSFRGPSLDAPPRPGAQTKWAWPLPPQNLALPVAWLTFCGLVHLASTKATTAKIAKLHASLAQLTLGRAS